MLKVKSRQDFGAGLLFVAIGLAGLYFGRELTFGSARSMGPGYFPTIIAMMIGLLGLLIMGRALAIDGPRIEPTRLRPVLMVMLSLVAFGLLIGSVGVVIASIALVLVAAYARRGASLVESLLFGAGAAAFVVLVFVYGLGQPLPLWWTR